jgi:hypothetical protein
MLMWALLCAFLAGGILCPIAVIGVWRLLDRMRDPL